jgi:hypothetical protein
MAERDPLLLKPGAHWQTNLGEHLSEDSWALLAGGRLAENERLALLDHVVGCKDCTRVYRTLVTLGDSARQVDPALTPGGLVQRPYAPGRRGLKTVLGGLTVAAAAAALVLVVRTAPPPDMPAGAPGTTRSTAIERPTLLEPVESRLDAPIFRWQPLNSSIGYRLELLDGFAEPLWAGEVGQTDSYPWPVDLAKHPGRYYWRVTALLEHGGELASELASFEIASSSPE